jgi:hypothetical protein
MGGNSISGTTSQALIIIVVKKRIEPNRLCFQKNLLHRKGKVKKDKVVLMLN